METQAHRDKSFKSIAFLETEISNGEFENCSFENCDLSNRVIRSSKFVDCFFTACNLSMTKLDRCQLNTIGFKGCKVLGVNFGDCVDIPFAVTFEGCVLDYCSFARMKIPKTPFVGSSMKNVDFTESDLTKAVFSHVDLTKAVFYRTILKEADFSTAENYSIDPEANTVRKAKFSVHGLAGLLDKYDITLVMT